jgi:hypothetical protein
MSNVNKQRVDKVLAQIRHKGFVASEDRLQLLEAGLTPAEASELITGLGLE